MPRCEKGTRMNKKTGNCEKYSKTKSSSAKSSSAKSISAKATRCKKGTRKNKKTGNCEPIKQSSPIKQASPVDTWRIYRIDYVYPSESVSKNKLVELSHDDKGVLNIENIYIENNTKAAQLTFEDNDIEIYSGIKQNTNPKILWEDQPTNNDNKYTNFINALLNTDISNIKFFGMENDRSNNYSTKENVKAIKDGEHGMYIKISPLNNFEDLNDAAKTNILHATKNAINSI